MLMLALLLATLLGGCVVTAITERPAYYTRYEVDAIQAENNCRALARNMLQLERCNVRR